MFHTRSIAFALAAAGALFIGGQAAAGPDVVVTNTPLPVTIANPANGTPVAFTLNSTGVPLPGELTVYTVPQNQRLMIEYASSVTCQPNTNLPAQLQTTTNGVPNLHAFAAPQPTLSSAFPGWSQFGHAVKIYADPGSMVFIHVNPTCTEITLSGQLLPVAP